MRRKQRYPILKGVSIMGEIYIHNGKEHAKHRDLVTGRFVKYDKGPGPNGGFYHSFETRVKLSQVHRGRPRPWSKGIPRSEVTKQRMRHPHIKRSPELRRIQW